MELLLWRREREQSIHHERNLLAFGMHARFINEPNPYEQHGWTRLCFQAGREKISSGERKRVFSGLRTKQTEALWTQIQYDALASLSEVMHYTWVFPISCRVCVYAFIKNPYLRWGGKEWRHSEPGLLGVSTVWQWEWQQTLPTNRGRTNR